MPSMIQALIPVRSTFIIIGTPPTPRKGCILRVNSRIGVLN